jgi:hypothetical protein
MPISVTWLNPEKTIIHLSYIKPWNWSDFESAVIQANMLLDTVDHPVNMIIQMHDGLPREINPARFRTVFSNFHKNIRSTALLGASDMVRVSINAFMRVLRQERFSFFFASTVDDAAAEFGKRHNLQ